jgi:hypothetical protein
MSAQEAIAASFADNNVAVMWDAKSPYCDVENRTVHLRPIPDLLSENDVEDVRGDCDHELGHIKFTDWPAFSKADRKMVQTITNSIEDGRIERLMAQEWFGCGENLERSSDRAITRIVSATKGDGELGLRARILCGLSLIAYGRDIDYVASKLGNDLRDAYAPVAATIAQVAACSSTQEVVELAHDLADHWQWQPIESTPAPNESPEDAAAGELSAKNLSVAAARKGAVSELEFTPSNSYRPRTANDRVEPIRRPSFDVYKLYGVFFDGIRKIVPTLRRRLLMEFRSAGRKEARHLKTGKLDERSLHRVIMGDPRVYKAPRRAIMHRSVVTLLVDCSSSMTHSARPEAFPNEPIVFRSKLFIAAQAAAAVSAVLDLLKIPNECLAFTTTRAPTTNQPGFDRVRPLRHLIIKPFNKSAHACRASFVSLALYEQCSENIDGEAVLWASKRLLAKASGHDNPVLMVFSDGEPASQPESAEVLSRHLIRAVKQAESAGIAVFAVGVASDAVKRFYENAAVVTDVTNLVADFYGLLKKVLRERLVLSLQRRV